MDDLALRAEIADVASDTSLDPAERISELRKAADKTQNPDLLGQIEGYIGSLELRREAGAIEAGIARIALRENANIRDYLLQRGEATPQELDAAGYLSHAELDAREQDGTLTEAIERSLEEGRMASEIMRWGKGFEHGGQFRPERGGSAGRRVVKALATGREKGDRKADPKAAVAKVEKVANAAPDVPEPQSPGIEPAIAERLAEIRKVGLNDWPELGPVGKSILQGKKDTQDLHSVAAAPSSPGTKGVRAPREYSPERAALHSKIMGEFTAGVDHEESAKQGKLVFKRDKETGKPTSGLAALLGEDDPLTQKVLNEGLDSLNEDERKRIREAAEAARNGAEPKALFMAGGPASGKTSALKQVPELKPDAAIEVNSDDVKVLLPEFQEQVKAGERAAASSVHQESNDVAYELVQRSNELGMNVVMDGTGNSKKGEFIKKLKEMRDSGYKLDVLCVTIPSDDAVVRATDRAEETGRWVPEPEIRKSHKMVSVNMEDVFTAPWIDSVTLYDNSGPKDADPELVGRGENGEFAVRDQGLMDKFRAKAHEPAFVPPEEAEDVVKTVAPDVPSKSESDREKLRVPETEEFAKAVKDKAADLEKTSAESKKAQSPGTETTEEINGKTYKVLEDGSVDVEGDVTMAADLLGRGRKVRLNQPDEVSTLLSELAARVQEAKEKGDKAPNFNLCDVSVPDTNLFCVESKGVPRVQMPQLAGFPKPGSKADKLGDEGLIERSDKYIDDATGKGGVDLTPHFVEHLRDRGVNVERGTALASHLRATQDELNGGNVGKIAREIEGGRAPDGATLVSRDNYIVDGHHRWAAQIGVDAADGNLANDPEMQVDRVDMDIITLLAEAYAYADEMGLPVVSAADAGKGEGGKKK